MLLGGRVNLPLCTENRALAGKSGMFHVKKLKKNGLAMGKTGFACWNVPPFSLLPQGGIPQDGLCPSEYTPHSLFLLRKRECAVHGGREKAHRDKLSGGAANSPIRRSDRYELPAKSGSLLQAALMNVPHRTASPHLKPRYSPGCKPERFPAPAPCVPLRCTLPGIYDERLHQPALSGAGSAEREAGGVLFAARGFMGLSARRTGLDALRTPPVPRRGKQVFAQNS